MPLSPFLIDYRLNPVLRKACKADIPKFCKDIVDNPKDDLELEGQVISCLKLRYADQVCHQELGENGGDRRISFLLSYYQLNKQVKMKENHHHT